MKTAANYWELRTQLEIMRQHVNSRMVELQKRSKDLTEINRLKVEQKCMNELIDRVIADYKELYYFGGVQELIRTARSVTPDDLFSQNS